MITITTFISTVLSLLVTLIYNLPVAWLAQQGYNILAPHINFPTNFTFMEWYLMWLLLCFIADKIIPHITVNK